MARKTSKMIQNTVKKEVKRQIRRRGGFGVVIFVILLAVIGYFNPALRDKIAEKLNVPASSSSLTAKDYEPLPSKKQSPLREGIWPVVHVADGDTLDVQDENGTKHRIRLIGADTPEVVKPNTPVQPFGPEASAFTKQVIVETGGRVRVAFDGDQVDKFGRNLAMIYLQTSQGEVWLNELLIREGLARKQLQYRFSKGAKERFRIAEEEAQAERKNIWSLPQ